MMPFRAGVSRRQVVAAILLFTLWQLPAHGQRDRSQNSRQFDEVWRTVRDHFFDPRLNGLDWRAVGDRYRPQAEAAATALEFQAVVNRMLGELHASHLGYYTDDDFEYYLLQSLFKDDMEGFQAENIGVLGERQGPAYIVRAVLDGSPAARAGIRVDDRLLTADGHIFTTVGSFREAAGRTVEITLDRPGAGRMTLRVTPVRQNPQRALLDATTSSVRVIDRGGRRIGYMHLWAMTNGLFRRALDDALERKLADTDGLVLDMRDGFGGQPFGFADVLFRPDVIWSQTDRNHPARTNHTSYTAPAVLLINRGTRSAKEYFAYQFRKGRRGPLVGTTTAGAFLGAGGFPISPDGYLELPVTDLSLDGKRLEGVGVAPDIPVEPADTYAPGDRQLARAIEVLVGRLGPSSNRIAARRSPGSLVR